MNSLAGLHSPATYCSVRMYAHTLTYFTAYHPPSTAASSTVPIKPLVGNVDFFKYESEKQNQRRIAMFNFQTFVILGLLVPVGNDQNKD